MSYQPVIHNVSIFSRAFWKGAGERAAKTFAQAIVGLPIFFGATGSGSVADLPQEVYQLETVKAALLGAAILALLSIFTSIANPTFVAGENANPPLDAPMPEGVAIPAGTGEHRATDDYEPTDGPITHGSSAASSEEDSDAPREDESPIVEPVELNPSRT